MNFNSKMVKLSSLRKFKIDLPSPANARNVFSKQHPRFINQLASYFHTSSYNKFSEENSKRYPGEGFITAIKRQSRWVLKEKSKVQSSTIILYRVCSNDIDFLTFFKKCKLPDTFLSWFLLTELHVWMCSVRLVLEDREGRFVINRIVNYFWDDVDARIAKLGKIPPGLKKDAVKELRLHFQAALFSYDEGLLGNDKILAAALWRNLFCFKCEHPEHLEIMVQYVRMQVSHLDLQSRETLFAGKIILLPLKGLDQTSKIA